MKVVEQSKSLESFWEELIYLEARLMADAKARHLAPRVVAHLATYDEILGVEKNVRREEVTSRARSKTVEDEIEGSFRELSVAALYDVKNDKKDRRYENLIHMNVTSFGRLSLAAQQAECHRMKSALKLTIYDDAFRDAQNELLDRILLHIDFELEAQARVNEQRAQSRVEIADWKDATNRVRMVIYGELITIAADKNSVWARSFFLAPKRRKLTEDEKAAKDAARINKAAVKAQVKAESLQGKADVAKRKSDLEAKKAALELAARKDARDIAEGKKAGEKVVVVERQADEVPVPASVPAPVEPTSYGESAQM